MSQTIEITPAEWGYISQRLESPMRIAQGMGYNPDNGFVRNITRAAKYLSEYRPCVLTSHKFWIAILSQACNDTCYEKLKPHLQKTDKPCPKKETRPQLSLFQ